MAIKFKPIEHKDYQIMDETFVFSKIKDMFLLVIRFIYNLQ